MAVQKDFKTGTVNLAAGESKSVVDEALTGQEMLTVERIAFSDDGTAELFGTLEVEKTTVYKDIPSAASPYPASQANREVFLCTPVVGILPEKRWKFTLTNRGALAKNGVKYYLPITRYTGSDKDRVFGA
jgi:hypothetical protein